MDSHANTITDGAGRHRVTQGFPLWLFVLAFVVSISTTCFTLWQWRVMESRAETLAAEHADLTEHIGRILLLDEVLTMSARMCAATRDFAYEQRYDQFDPELALEIEGLREKVPRQDLEEYVKSTDAANRELVQLERTAFALTHHGKADEALRLLSGSDYAHLKSLYSKGMNATSEAARAVIRGEYMNLRERSRWLMGGSAVGVLALLAAWIAAVRSARAWVVVRTETENERYRQLEAIGREKDEFLATVSHSLKTPLNPILGFSELLKDGLAGELSATQQDLVQGIHDSGMKQLVTVSSLLELAELQCAKVELKMSRLDASAVMRDITEQQLASMRAANIKFTHSIASDLGVISFDRGLVTRVLDVLFENARRFTPSGGEISFSARRVGHSLELVVADTGCGIAPDVLPRLFRPFMQGDGTLARSHQGTGIGLTLVKKWLELHGGACRAESVLGHGARFVVLLPIESGSQ